MPKNLPLLTLITLSGLLFLPSGGFSRDDKEKERDKEKEKADEKPQEKSQEKTPEKSPEKSTAKAKEKGPEKDEKEQPPSFARLLELNKDELFGGEATIGGDHVTVKCSGKGAFNRAFLAKGFAADPAEIKGGKNREAYLDKKPGELSCVGTDGGSAISKFELADEFNISFKLKIPTLLPQGTITLRMNQQDSKNFIQSSFFTDLAVVENGKPKKTKLTSSQHFQGLPSKWFDRKDEKGLNVEVAFKEKKLRISLSHRSKDKEKPKDEMLEVVSLEGVESPSSGKLGIFFNKVSFGVYDLSIDGKINRSWAEKEIQRLKDEGKLRTKEEETIVKKDEKGGAAGSKAQVKGPRVKKGPVNVDEPDPEAEVDL